MAGQFAGATAHTGFRRQCSSAHHTLAACNETGISKRAFIGEWWSGLNDAGYQCFVDEYEPGRMLLQKARMQTDIEHMNAAGIRRIFRHHKRRFQALKGEGMCGPDD